MPAVKILLAGDVGGKIDALFARVDKVNSSNGPFDLLLCVGGFFAPGKRWRGCRRAHGSLLVQLDENSAAKREPARSPGADRLY